MKDIKIKETTDPFKFTILIKNKTNDTKYKSIEINLKEIYNINETDMKTTCENHVEYYGQISTIKYYLTQKFNEAKVNFVNSYAQQDESMREDFKFRQIKPTETTIQRSIEATEQFKKEKSQLKQVESQLELINQIIATLEHKRDMIKEINKIQISENYN